MSQKHNPENEDCLFQMEGAGGGWIETCKCPDDWSKKAQARDESDDLALKESDAKQWADRTMNQIKDQQSLSSKVLFSPQEHDETQEEKTWEEELEQQDWFKTFTQEWQDEQCVAFITQAIEKAREEGRMMKGSSFRMGYEQGRQEVLGELSDTQKP